MKSLSPLSMVVAVVVLLAAYVSSPAQIQPESGGNKNFRSPFRYVIVGEKVVSKSDEQNGGSRGVVVLLDAKAFSKECIVSLYGMISKRYPVPSLLLIQIFTSLDDVDTPEEKDAGSFSETDSNRPLNDRAVIVRTKTHAFANIYFAKGNFEEVDLTK